MYSPHQIACMEELGVKFYQVNDDDAANSSSSSMTTELNLPASFTDDLKVLFPNLTPIEDALHLTPTLKWIIQKNATRVLATQTQIISPSFDKLNVNDWRKIWSALQNHAISADNNS